MFINLLEIMCLNQYIISPKTWIHKINDNIKIFIIFITLMVLPYINYTYLSILLIIHICLILYSKIPKNKFFKNKYLLFGLLMLIFSIYLNNINSQTYLFFVQQISIILQRPIIFIEINYRIKSYLKLGTSYYIFIFPKYIIRVILIYFIYFISLKILYKTTKYENIVIYYLMNYLIKQNKKKILIITFASNFLILVSNQIYFIEVSIKLRNRKIFFPKYIYYYALKELLNNISEEIKRISCILYCRELNYKNLNIANIYYNYPINKIHCLNKK